MRILDINNRIPYPLRDGGAISIYGMLEAMHRAGMDVTFFALNTLKHHQDPAVMAPVVTKVHAPDIDTAVTAWGALRSLLFPASLRPYGMQGRASYWIERFLSAECLARLEDVVRSEGPFDIVQSESIFVAPYAVALRAKGLLDSRTRIVLRSHNVEHQIQARLATEASRSWAERWYRGVLARQTERFEASCARYFDAVATVTEADEAYFRTASPDANTCTIQPGVPIPELVPVQVDPDAICLLASLEWAPNVEGAIWFVRNVMPLIRAHMPRAVVHIAGRNPSREVLALHNGDSVVVHGEVADAASFRRERAISIVPLFSGSGLRMKILEALALETTVVSTSVGAEGIALVDGTHICIANDAAAFADACVRLMQHPAQARAMAAAGRSLATEHFGWQPRVGEFRRLYADVLSRTVTRPEP